MSLVQLQSTLSNAITSSEYNINTLFNSSLFGIPIMTVSLIGVTSMVLAYVTLVESDTTTGNIMPDLGIPKSTILPTQSPVQQYESAQVTGGKHKGNKNKTKGKYKANKNKTR